MFLRVGAGRFSYPRAVIVCLAPFCHALFVTRTIALDDFDELLPELNKNDLPHNWWTIDLCFWADAWQVTEDCKRAADELNAKYGG